MAKKRKGHRVGYIRVSALDQSTERQLDGIALDKVFTDKASGRDANRPALQDALMYCREGDTLYVHTLDRLARNVRDLLDIVETLILNADELSKPIQHPVLARLDGIHAMLEELLERV